MNTTVQPLDLSKAVLVRQHFSGGDHDIIPVGGESYKQVLEMLALQNGTTSEDVETRLRNREDMKTAAFAYRMISKGGK